MKAGHRIFFQHLWKSIFLYSLRPDHCRVAAHSGDCIFFRKPFRFAEKNAYFPKRARSRLNLSKQRTTRCSSMASSRLCSFCH